MVVFFVTFFSVTTRKIIKLNLSSNNVKIDFFNLLYGNHFKQLA